MNAIFLTILIASLLILTIINPELILLSLSSSVEKTTKLTLSLLSIYVIWCGFSSLLENSNLTKKISILFRPIINKLFGKVTPETSNLISMNLSCNLLGLGGLATPYAIDAFKLLENENNEHAKNLLFVISATSIQLLPTSVIQLLVENGEANASYIIIPSLISTLISTIIGITLCKVFR